jgi:YD repeat-containing protein
VAEEHQAVSGAVGPTTPSVQYAYDATGRLTSLTYPNGRVIAYNYAGSDALLGRFVSRDPLGYVDGMNLYQGYFVPGGMDPSGRRFSQGDEIALHGSEPEWEQMVSNSNRWKSKKDGASLLALAAKVSANPSDWSCIWPIIWKHPETYDMRSASCGDIVDVSNLTVSKKGPSLYLTVEYSDDYIISQPKAIRLQANQVDEHFRRMSQEGANPIQYIQMQGHGGGAVIGPTSPGISERLSLPKDNYNFRPSNYNPNEPSPTFERASQRRGPRRCWFETTARGAVLSCVSRQFALDFASTYLRRGSHIRSTSDFTYANIPAIPSVWWTSWDRPDWGVGSSPDTARWYRNVDSLADALPEIFPGAL